MGEAENRYVDKLIIEPQTFCGLKEIELKVMNIQQKTNSISRHTVVCRASQQAGVPHREYINRKKTRFSYHCSSVFPYPIDTTFSTDVPTR